MAAKYRRGLFYGGLFGGMLLALAIVGMSGAADSDESLDDRRVRLAKMETAERDQLAQNYDRFLHLEPEERDRLRQLHAELEADPDRDELRRVMQNYHQWLDRLSPAQRVKLAALSTDERLKQIDEWQAHDRKRFRLNRQDLAAVDQWLAKHNRLQIWGPAWRNNKERGDLTREAVAELHEALSPPARQALDEAKSPEERGRLVLSWVNQARRAGDFGGGPGRPGPGNRWPNGEQTREFLNQLTEEERQHLRSLPTDQMRGELGRLWREHHPNPRDDRRGPGARPDRPPATPDSAPDSSPGSPAKKPE